MTELAIRKLSIITSNLCSLCSLRSYSNSSWRGTAECQVIGPNQQFIFPVPLATVLVHLFAAALHRNSSSRALSETDPNMKLAGLYIRCQSPFAEVDEFVNRCQEIYHIDLMTVNDSLKNGLNAFLQERACIRAILIGTRATDPNGGQSSFPYII